jgi:hypothetical protein
MREREIAEREMRLRQNELDRLAELKKQRRAARKTRVEVKWSAIGRRGKMILDRVLVGSDPLNQYRLRGR